MNAKNYLKKVAVSPREFYEGTSQATINQLWQDTCQIRNCWERNITTGEYEPMEIWLSSVSDNLTAPNKIYSNFVEVIFKDCQRPYNYRGQYYKIELDKDLVEQFICYEAMSRTSKIIAKSKLVRCNNVLRFVNSDGKICEYPCYIGELLTSTNQKIAKDGNVENGRLQIIVPYDENTAQIVVNQRFMFGKEHKSAFIVETFNDFLCEVGMDRPTMLQMFIDRCSILPSDNTELNLCDYQFTETIVDETRDKHIVLTPNNVAEIFEQSEINFEAHVESDGIATTDVVTCTCTGTRDGYTSFDEIDVSHWKVSELRYYKGDVITLTFSANDCDDIVVNLKVRRLF